MTPWSILATALLLGACLPEPEEPASAAAVPAPPAQQDHAQHAQAGIPAVEREHGWMRLRAWLQGAPVDREPATGPPSGDATERGRLLFATYCANCHGPSGRGDGPRAPVFDPPPRDIARGVFKFRSTPSGHPPRAEDLFRTVSGGLRGTGMMPFADLPEPDRWALVAYVRELSGTSSADDAPRIDAPMAPRDLDTPARAHRGGRAFRTLCASCHGTRGRGDGPAAATLRDDLGRLVLRPDLVARPLKRGDDAGSIYLTLATGLDGTPMPAYGHAVPADALWDLVSHVRWLRRSGAATLSARDREEAETLLSAQSRQAEHAVVGGCGCQARRRSEEARR